MDLMQISDDVSQKIGLGAFLCSLEIAMFHAPGSWANLTPAASCVYRAVEPLTQAALAFFFAVSGYFLWGKILDKHSYVKVIVKRIRTLIVPFVLWNLIFLGCVWLMFRVLTVSGQVDEFSSLMPGGGERWQSINVLSFIRNCPNPVLWFLRTLFVLVLLVPLLAGGVKQWKSIFVFVLGGICLVIETFHLSFPGITLLQPRAVFYFTFGVWWHSREAKLSWSNKRCWLLAICGYLLSFASPIGYFMLMLGFYGCLSCIGIGRMLQRFAFPLYMVHYLGIWFFLFLNALWGFVQTGTVWWVISTGIFTIGISLLFIVALRMTCPKACYVLFGGR